MFQTSWEIINKGNHYVPRLHEKIHPIIQKILINRGITNDKEIKEFLSSKPKKTYDPFLMKNMNEIVQIIMRYIKEKKNIWIYGDYDSDGISSIALLLNFLGHFTQNLNYYIPIREEEGYGLNCNAIHSINNRGGDLIITVDCGSTSMKEVELAKQLGMDIIITDHHNLSDEIPDCFILNPKQKDCPYPFKSLCGCGVAFKLVQGLQRKLGAPKAYLKEVLDLVALATVSDVVPLVDENRTMLKYGLKALNHPRRPGLRALIEEIGLKDKEITAGHIGFLLGPHFNASGRIHDASVGVELLLTKKKAEIHQLVKYLIRCNQERKILQEKGLEICKDKVEQLYLNDLFLVIDSGSIHEGVIGIIAGKIRDLYYRPTLIVTQSSEEGILKGSGRSIDDIDIYEEMKKCADLFIKFGGHKNACGFSIHRDNLQALRKRLNEQMQEIKHQLPSTFIKTIKIDTQLTPSEITEELIEELRKVEPYGIGNEKPKFLIQQVQVDNERNVVAMGKSGEHVKFKDISNRDKESKAIDAIGFDMAEFYIKHLGCPETIDIVGFPNINEWNGYRNIQFLISDIKKFDI